MNCTPKVRQKKSNLGCFYYEITYEDKVLIYEQTTLNFLNNNQKTTLKC